MEAENPKSQETQNQDNFIKYTYIYTDVIVRSFVSLLIMGSLFGVLKYYFGVEQLTTSFIVIATAIVISPLYSKIKVSKYIVPRYIKFVEGVSEWFIKKYMTK